MERKSTLHVAPNHPAFAGHFPDQPIMPGVVLLDAAIHAALQMLDLPTTMDEQGKRIETICQIDSAKFFSPVGPGEALTIALSTAASGNTRFDIASGSRKVATGTLVWSTLS